MTTNKKCFVSDLGKYYSTTDTFIPNEGVAVPEDYVANTYKEVQRMFTYSERILFNNYYKVLGFDYVPASVEASGPHTPVPEKATVPEAPAIPEA